MSSSPPPLNYSGSVAPVPAMPISPLSPEQLKDLAVARQRGKKIQRAIAVAKFDGWTAGVFGALSLVCGFSTVVGVVIGVGLLVVAWVELQAANRLKALDASAPRTLAINQLALGALLIGYGVYQLTLGYGAMTDPYTEIKKQSPEIARSLGPLEDLTKVIIQVLYGGLIVGSILSQGGLAWYYHTREKYVWAYVTETPEWILQLQRAGVGV